MNTPSHPRRGFTLVELLVVLGVIALLVAILLPTLLAARRTAGQVRALSDVRQLLVAHGFYRLDHKGRVPLGYPPQTLGGTSIEFAYDGYTIDPLLAQRYPFRFVPYLDDVWDLVFSGQPTPDETALYDRSISTTYGLNSTYVGGESGIFGRGFVERGKASLPDSDLSKYLPGSPTFMMVNANRHVVFRESEVREPSSLIVFADSKLRGGPFGGGGDGGYCNVHAPLANGQLWQVVDDPDSPEGKIEVVASRAIGIPEGRFGKGAATGFFDGHAESRHPDDLLDMRLWANWAEAHDDDFVP